MAAKKTVIEFQKASLTYRKELPKIVKKLDDKFGLFSKKPLSFIKGKEYVALRGVDLKVKEGEFVALLGMSGAGKTTIIKSLNGTVKLSKGKLLVHDEDITKYNAIQLRKLKRKISTIFQDYDLVPTQTVIQNVMLFDIIGKDWMSRTFNTHTDSKIQEAYQMLENLGILEHAHRKVLELSGGQKQRVALTRSLLQHPKILLADEPVSALDPKMLQIVMDQIKTTSIEKNLTTIVNLHHIEVALRYADRIVGLNNGKVVIDKSVKSITKKDIEKIYGKAVDLSDNQIKLAKEKGAKWTK